MSNRNRRRKEKKGKGGKEYNSWLAVLIFSVIDGIFSISHAGEITSLFGMCEKLGEKGTRRQELLMFVVCGFISAGVFVVTIELIGRGNTELWFMILISAVGFVACVVLGIKKWKEMHGQ